MSDLTSPKYNSNVSFKTFNNPPRPVQQEKIDLEGLQTDYLKALNYIENLKAEQINIKVKNGSTPANYESNSSTRKKSNNQQTNQCQEYGTPKVVDQRILELERENNELKALFEAHSRKMMKLQREQQHNLERLQELETLQFENKELKVELSCLNKEFCAVTNKLLEVEGKNFNLLSRALEQKQELQGVDKASFLKYANYIYQLVNSVDKNHFSYCCFEERFAKGANFFSLIRSNDQPALLLKAFKYITDLLININSQYYSGSAVPSGTPSRHSYRRHINGIDFGDMSRITEDSPKRDLIRRAETPQDYHLAVPIETPKSHIRDKFGTRSPGESIKNEEIEQYVKESSNQGLSQLLDFRIPKSREQYDRCNNLTERIVADQLNSEREVQSKKARSTESSPRASQTRNNYRKEESNRDKEREDFWNDHRYETKLEQEIFASQDQELIARFIQLRKRCKAIRESEELENNNENDREIQKRQMSFAEKNVQNDEEQQPRSQRVARKIEEKEYQEIQEKIQEKFQERNQRVYKEPQNTDYDEEEQSRYEKASKNSEKASQKSSVNRLKVFLNNGKTEKEADAKRAVGTIQRKGQASSKQNQSEMVNLKEKTQDESYNAPNKIKLNVTATVNGDDKRKATRNGRDRTTSINREDRSRKHTPKTTSRVNSPQGNAVYHLKATKKNSGDNEEQTRPAKRLGKHNSSTSFDMRGTEFSSFTVSFWKNEPRGKSSHSPPPKVPTIDDVPRKKKVNTYCAQTYDVIKGADLVGSRRYK